MCEKPLAVNEHERQAMIRACERRRCEIHLGAYRLHLSSGPISRPIRIVQSGEDRRTALLQFHLQPAGQGGRPDKKRKWVVAPCTISASTASTPPATCSRPTCCAPWLSASKAMTAGLIEVDEMNRIATLEFPGQRPRQLYHQASARKTALSMKSSAPRGSCAPFPPMNTACPPAWRSLSAGRPGSNPTSNATSSAPNSSIFPTAS